jgi:hypothetical protein
MMALRLTMRGNSVILGHLAARTSSWEPARRRPPPGLFLAQFHDLLLENVGDKAVVAIRTVIGADVQLVRWPPSSAPP